MLLWMNKFDLETPVTLVVNQEFGGKALGRQDYEVSNRNKKKSLIPFQMSDFLMLRYFTLTSCLKTMFE